MTSWQPLYTCVYSQVRYLPFFEMSEKRHTSLEFKADRCLQCGWPMFVTSDSIGELTVKDEFE